MLRGRADDQWQLGDKFGGRRMMCLGAVVSFALNWVASLGTSFQSLAAAWGLNGFAQSMGWAPGSRIVSNWSGAHERGRAFGFYVLAAGMSSALTYATSLLVLDVLHLDWRWLFRLPVFLMLLGALVVWLLARDRPSSVGFADLHDEGGPPRDDTETAWQRYGLALKNGKLLLAGLAIGFQNTVRYGLLIWVPVYFLGKDFKDDQRGKWISKALAVGMALGALASGWISNRVCNSRRSGVVASFMLPAAVSAMGMYLLPPGHRLGVPVAAMIESPSFIFFC